MTIHSVLWWNARGALRAGGQDFTAFYAAGKLTLQGRGSQLYDRDAQYQEQQEVTSRTDAAGEPLRFIHPPLEAFLFAPLARLPYFQAYLLWAALNLAALLAAVMMLREQLPNLRGEPLLMWILIGPAFFPAMLAVIQGQDIVWLLLVYAMAWTALKRQSEFAAGCWLGVGLFRFHLVVPLLIVMAILRKWRVLAGCGVVAIVGTVASAALVGWRETLSYPAYIVQLARGIGAGMDAPEHMPNLAGLIYAALRPEGSHLFANVLVGVLSLALLWMAASACAVKSPSLFGLQFSAALLATILASYHAFDYDLTLALLPVLMIADYSLGKDIGRKERWVLLAPAVAMFLTPLHLLLLFRWKYACLFSIVLLGWFYVMVRRIRQVGNGAILNA